MKLLVVLLCLAAVESRHRIPCPLPQYTNELDEDICNKLTACEWVNSECLLRHQEELGYVISEEKKEKEGVTSYSLSYNSKLTLFGKNIPNLGVDIISYDKSHFRIKIFDKDSARYEVPIPLNLPDPVPKPEDAQYDVIVKDQTPGQLFDFKVIRKETGTVLFDTSVISGFVFEDQFLQITTSLPSSYLYGMGENIHESFRHSFDNQTFTVFAKDRAPDKGPYNLYGTHPVYHCIEDDQGNSHAVLFLNSNAMEYSLRGLPDGKPGLVYRTIGGILDMHFFLGPQPEDLIQQYTKMVGLPFMPPFWGLGFMLSRWGYNNITNMQAAVDRTREADIPLDVQFLDIDYFDRKRDFTYDKVNFAGLPEYLRQLKTEGVRFIPIVDPAVVIDFDNYPPSQRGKDMDVFVKWPSAEDVPADQPPEAKDYMVGYVWPDCKTVFPDFLWKDTQDWWVEEAKIYHETIPFDGMWIDMNEPSNFGTNDKQPENWPENLPPWSLKCRGNQYDEPPYPTSSLEETPTHTFSDKTICMIGSQRISDGKETKTYKHYDVHSLYGWGESVASYRANHEATGQRPLLISRSTYPSSGKYVAHWLGDNFSRWNDMRRSLIGMFEFNMFGIPFNGADICGFIFPTTEELCKRWMAVGAFYPFSRNHNVWDAPDQDPGLWESVAEVSRRALGARYHLLPYLYTLMYHAHTQGRSVVRPLLNEFPSDLQARDVDNAFLWGSSILIVPFLEEGSHSREMYFPDGHWYSYWDRLVSIDKPGVYTIEDTDMPVGVYLRGGAIIPTKKPEHNTNALRTNPFGLLIVWDDTDKASGDLFWDDGVTEGSIEAQNYYYSTFTFEEGTLTMEVTKTLEVEGDELDLEEIEILGCPQGPGSVTINGQTSEDFEYNAMKKTVTIHLKHDMNKPLTVQIQ